LQAEEATASRNSQITSLVSAEEIVYMMQYDVFTPILLAFIMS
jgi:hypothetical protein